MIIPMRFLFNRIDQIVVTYFLSSWVRLGDGCSTGPFERLRSSASLPLSVAVLPQTNVVPREGIAPNAFAGTGSIAARLDVVQI
jgi:hypothetical protein